MLSSGIANARPANRKAAYVTLKPAKCSEHSTVSIPWPAVDAGPDDSKGLIGKKSYFGASRIRHSGTNADHIHATWLPAKTPCTKTHEVRTLKAILAF